jgi:hypothetical protein
MRGRAGEISCSKPACPRNPPQRGEAQITRKLLTLP